jgi:hypothetical protein
MAPTVNLGSRLRFGGIRLHPVRSRRYSSTSCGFLQVVTMMAGCGGPFNCLGWLPMRWKTARWQGVEPRDLMYSREVRKTAG